MRKVVCCTAIVLLSVLAFSGSYGQCSISSNFSYAINSANWHSVNFIDQSTADVGIIQGYGWNFGDNTTSAEPNPIHSYNMPGTYTGKHWAYTSDVCVSDTEVIISGDCILNVPLSAEEGAIIKVLPGAHFSIMGNLTIVH